MYWTYKHFCLSNYFVWIVEPLQFCYKNYKRLLCETSYLGVQIIFSLFSGKCGNAVILYLLCVRVLFFSKVVSKIFNSFYVKVWAIRLLLWLSDNLFCFGEKLETMFFGKSSLHVFLCNSGSTNSRYLNAKCSILASFKFCYCK